MGLLDRLFPLPNPDVRSREEARLFEQVSDPPRWSAYSQYGSSYSPVYVDRDTAAGLPAVGRAIRLVSRQIANLPMLVYQGRLAEKRLRDDTWQFRLLHELPGMGDFSPFDLFSDIAACLETVGNAFLLKVKAAGEVVALIVIDPHRVQMRRVDGEKRFEVFNPQGQREERSASTILHIRGFTLGGGDVGLSPIGLHRASLGEMVASEQFTGRFFGQGAPKKVAFRPGQDMTLEKAQEWMALWKVMHTGTANSGLPAMIPTGMETVDIGMSLEDAQFVEGEKLDLVKAAHIFDLPAKFLTGEGDLDEWDFIALNQLGIAPRLRNITSALHVDADLFPDRALYPEFDVRELVRTDAKTKAEVEHMQIQDGTMLVDEARADRGQPPLVMPDDPYAHPGMVPQLTPVGGAPNPGGRGSDRGMSLEDAESWGLAAQRVGLALSYGLITPEEGREILGLEGDPPPPSEPVVPTVADDGE